MTNIFGSQFIIALCAFALSVSIPAMGRADCHGDDCCGFPGFGLVRCVASGAVSVVEEVVDVITPCCCDDGCDDHEECSCEHQHDE